MTQRTEVQIAIRTKQYDGTFRYNQYVDNGPGAPVSMIKLTVDTAKKQLRLYTKDSEPTVVTRTVVIDEGEWEEVDTSEVHNLAVLLHTKQCHYNHEDQCGWGYEGTWEGTTHKRYAAKAKAILERTSYEAAKELLEIL